MTRTLPLTTKTPDGYMRCRARRGTTVVHLARPTDEIWETACGLPRARSRWPIKPHRCCATCWKSAAPETG